LVLDFAENVSRHGPINMVSQFVKDKAAGKGKNNGDNEAPTKVCSDCQEICYAGLKECPVCGFEFPPPDVSINKTASEEDIISYGAPRIEDVIKVKYSRHQRGDKKPSLRVDYYYSEVLYPQGFVSEWIFLEGWGEFGARARQWWRNRFCGEDENFIPRTVEQAMDYVGQLAEPVQIEIRKQGRYDKVTAYRMH